MPRVHWIVGRHINGITINPMEWLLTNDRSRVLRFTSARHALSWLSTNAGIKASDQHDLAERYGLYLMREGYDA